MPGSYETEVRTFKTVFEPLKKKKIVLYGIGRYTATLIPEIPDYNIIGFMDRDPENIGKIIYGLPVMGREQVEKEADIIIINTVEAYWKTIFARIQDISVPVFFRNGKRAQIDKVQADELDYWDSSYDEMRKKAENYDVISFDVFDTLIMRSVYVPKDVWSIIEASIEKKWKKNINFRELRERANGLAKANSTLDEIYEILKEISDWDENEISEAKDVELLAEDSLMVPRYNMVEFCRNLIEAGKEVYFISDMYLPVRWFSTALKKIGIVCDDRQIIISSDWKADKKSGSLWGLYQERIVKGRKALHIGDDETSDIFNASANGIETYRVMAGRDLLSVSSMRRVEPYICSQAASRTVGLIIQKLMNNPFSLNKRRGMIQIEEPETFGYCVFGPVIHTFLVWLIQQANKDGIQQLFFVSRDGYFLLEDYEYLIREVAQGKIKCPKGQYLLTSRLVALEAGIQDESGLKEVMRFPFVGSFSDYMQGRFGIETSIEDEHGNELIQLPGNEEKLLQWIQRYKNQIMYRISERREQYLRYLDGCDIRGSAAVVDTWYYGHTQAYLNRLLDTKVAGYYFAANLSDSNECAVNNTMTPCFQKPEDPRAEMCRLFKKALITESFLTAPYGMIQEVYEDGSFRCGEERENQKRFEIKRKINSGVKRFISDFWKELPTESITEILPDQEFIDALFGFWFDGGCELEKVIKDSFWSDNELVQKREFKIFD